MSYAPHKLTPDITNDPYYPLDQGTVRVYRSADRRSALYTRVKRLDCKHDDLWRLTVGRLSTLTGKATKERLRIRPSGVYVRREDAEFGPVLQLPLTAGDHWVAGAETAHPLHMEVRRPVPVSVNFGRLNGCLRVFQSDPAGTLVRTEWYAPEIGLVRWVTHCADHEEMHELAYLRDGVSGAERGYCPEDVVQLLSLLDADLDDPEGLEITARPDSSRPKIGVQRHVRLSDVRTAR